MVDALASGASTGNGVEVRVLSWAPKSSIKTLDNLGYKGFLLYRSSKLPHRLPHAGRQ